MAQSSAAESDAAAPLRSQGVCMWATQQRRSLMQASCGTWLGFCTCFAVPNEEFGNSCSGGRRGCSAVHFSRHQHVFMMRCRDSLRGFNLSVRI